MLFRNSSLSIIITWSTGRSHAKYLLMNAFLLPGMWGHRQWFCTVVLLREKSVFSPGVPHLISFSFCVCQVSLDCPLRLFHEGSMRYLIYLRGNVGGKCFFWGGDLCYCPQYNSRKQNVGCRRKFPIFLKGNVFCRFPQNVPCFFPFLFFVPFSIGNCVDHSQSVMLGASSEHFKCRILRRHLLMKSAVFCLVSSAGVTRSPIHWIGP